MIVHDKEKNKFFEFIEKNESQLVYTYTDKDIVDIHTTFVHETHRGQGVAKRLVESAIDFAKDNKLKITPSCSYVKNYFDKNKELKDLVSI